MIFQETDQFSDAHGFITFHPNKALSRKSKFQIGEIFCKVFQHVGGSVCAGDLNHVFCLDGLDQVLHRVDAHDASGHNERDPAAKPLGLFDIMGG